jgi:hypothetical protein
MATSWLFLAKMRSGDDIGLIRRFGGGFGSSFGLGIGCSVTADQNEITAKRRVSEYRNTGLTSPAGHPQFCPEMSDAAVHAAKS